MLSNKALATIFAKTVETYGVEEAELRMLEKYPEHAGEIAMLISGDFEVDVDHTLRQAAKEDIKDLMKLPEPGLDEELDLSALKSKGIDPADEDLDGEELPKPAVVEAPVKQPKVKTPKAPKEDKPAKTGGKSKIALATELYKTMTAASSVRKDIIAAFVGQLGLTANGASTYYQNIKKAN